MNIEHIEDECPGEFLLDAIARFAPMIESVLQILCSPMHPGFNHKKTIEVLTNVLLQRAENKNRLSCLSVVIKPPYDFQYISSALRLARFAGQLNIDAIGLSDYQFNSVWQSLRDEDHASFRYINISSSSLTRNYLRLLPTAPKIEHGLLSPPSSP